MYYIVAPLLFTISLAQGTEGFDDTLLGFGLSGSQGTNINFTTRSMACKKEKPKLAINNVCASALRWQIQTFLCLDPFDVFACFDEFSPSSSHAQSSSLLNPAVFSEKLKIEFSVSATML